MWIYLVRHAETDGNLNRIVQCPNTPLSIRGMRQAQQFADYYSCLPITGILSSDYKRAHTTASVLQAKISCKTTLSELLRERNFGDLRGKSYSDIPQNTFEFDFHPPKGESYMCFVKRVKNAWKHIVESQQSLNGDLLIVTHGLVLRCIFTEILRLQSSILEKADIQNTCVTKINAHDHTLIPLLCDVKHLHDKALQRRE
jgi:broad specificity phosphatase PhoE